MTRGATTWRVTVEEPRERSGKCWMLRIRAPRAVGGDSRKTTGLSVADVPRAQAEAQARELEAGLNAGLGRAARLTDVIAAYLAKAQGIAPQTQEKVGVVRKHVLRVLGDLRVDALDKAALLRLQDDLRALVAPTTVNVYMALLSMVWEWSRERGHVPDRDLPRVKRLEEQETKKRPFTAQERVEVLAWVKRMAPWWYPCMCALADSGARAGELLGATHADLDRETGALTLRKTKRKRGVQRARVVYLSPETVALFPADKPAHWPLVESPVHRGHPPRRHALTWCLVRAFRDLELPRDELGSHSFRRAWVQDAEQAQVPRVLAMRLTGHTTEEIYLGYQRHSKVDLAATAEAVRAFRASSPTSSPTWGGTAATNLDATGTCGQESTATRKPMFRKEAMDKDSHGKGLEHNPADNPPRVALDVHPVSRLWSQDEDSAAVAEVYAMGEVGRRALRAVVRRSVLRAGLERVGADLHPDEWLRRDGEGLRAEERKA